MNSRVRWYDCVEQYAVSRRDPFCRDWPGGVLTKMLKRRVGRDIALFSVQDAASFEAFLRANMEACVMSRVALVTADPAASAGPSASGCKRWFDVAVHCNSNVASAEAVCREVEAAGRRAVALQADLTDPAACERLTQACIEQLGDGMRS
jgi:hypothetical protein